MVEMPLFIHFRKFNLGFRSSPRWRSSFLVSPLFYVWFFFLFPIDKQVHSGLYNRFFVKSPSCDANYGMVFITLLDFCWMLLLVSSYHGSRSPRQPELTLFFSVSMDLSGLFQTGTKGFFFGGVDALFASSAFNDVHI